MSPAGQHNTSTTAAEQADLEEQAPLRPYRDDSDEDSLPPDAPLRLVDDFDELSTSTSKRPQWQTNLISLIPERVRHGWDAIVEWTAGPNPPRIFHITPIFPQIQHAPIKFLDRFAPKKYQRFWLLILLYFCWALTLSLFLWKSSIAAQIPGYGNPIRLGCGARYWDDFNGCGLNGDRCRPFANSTLAFRCPADCKKTLVLNPHAVGDQEVVYKPLVVGGPADHHTGFEDDIVEDAIYRGDSFICASAVHAGFIKDIEGGCGVLTLTGEQPSFSASKRHGIDSTGFDSYFPQSFAFLKGTRAECKDLRWAALAPSVIFTVLLSLFTTNAAVQFWSIFIMLFFHVALVSDPPSMTSYYDLISIAFGRLLPACFCAYVVYRFAVKRSLTNLTAQIEKTILWLGPAWVGSLNNYTFDRIPIQRLTPHDIQAQPGAVPALIIIITIIIAIALGQAWAFRVEGRMRRYLVVYGLMSAALLIMLALPNLDLRIHHYILGLLFLPGTSFQNRPSLIYQGLLIGLFINGVARWGFASILETPGSILRGVAQGTLLPAVSVLAIGAKNITFNIGPLPIRDPESNVVYDGISVLVNDVERLHAYGDDMSYWDEIEKVDGQNFTWTWRRHRVGRKEGVAVDVLDLEEDLDLDLGLGVDEGVEESEMAATRQTLPEYFRFGYMSGNSIADFSKAGKWKADGSWVQMDAGPSLRK